LFDKRPTVVSCESFVKSIVILGFHNVRVVQSALDRWSEVWCTIQER